MTLSRTTYKLLIYVLPVVLVALGLILLYEILPALAQQTPAQADVDAARRLAAEAARATETQNTFIARVLWWVVATVFGGLTWVAGGLLDWSITTLVLNFGTIFQNSGLGVAVNQLWAVVRDIFNLTFIFGLVYIGFRLVVNAESSTARKAIVSLIIAALLVNFSLFITKTVIDFSNIAAVQISQLIYSGNLPTSNSTSSISLAFGNQMGLASLWGQSEAEVQRNTIANNRNTAPSGGLLYIFGAMILFLIAAFAFIVGAVLLISRFIALNFMMILSPVMFLGFVFAPLQSLSSQYWSKFLNQCFFAPAFLLMIYFSLYILGTFTSIVRQQGSTIANTLENGTNISSIAGFLLGGGFLLASVMIAQKMGAHGASTAMKIGGNFVNKARSVATGAALAVPRAALAVPRLAGRQSIGRFGKYVDGKLENRGFRADNTLRTMAKSATEAKFGGSSSFKSVKDAKKARDQFMARKVEVDNVSKAITAYTTAGARATPQQKIDMERAIAGASSEQIAKLLDKHETGAERDALITNMSASQYDGVMKTKDEDMNDKAKKKITDARSKSIQDSLSLGGRKDFATASARAEVEKNAFLYGATPDAAAKQAAKASVDAEVTTNLPNVTAEQSLMKGIGKASYDQLRVLGPKILEDNAAGLSFSQIDDIKKAKSEDFTETEKGRIIASHKTAWLTKFASGANARTILTGLSEADVAKLPVEILTHKDIGPYLKPRMLSQMMTTLDAGQRSIVRDNLFDLTAAASNTYHRKDVEEWFTRTPAAKEF